MPQSKIPPDRILELIKAYHAIGGRFVNSIPLSSEESRTHWNTVLSEQYLAAVAPTDAQQRRSCELVDQVALSRILGELARVAGEHGLDASCIYDVTGNMLGATIEKWDKTWSFVRVIHDSARAESDASESRNSRQHKRKKVRSTVRAADAALQHLWKTNPDRFFASTRDQLAIELSISAGLISKTATWHEYRRRGRRPKAVGLDIALEKEAELNHLIDEQRRDSRPASAYKRV